MTEEISGRKVDRWLHDFSFKNERHCRTGRLNIRRHIGRFSRVLVSIFRRGHVFSGAYTHKTVTDQLRRRCLVAEHAGQAES